MTRRQKDILRKAADLLLALGIGAAGTAAAILAVRFRVAKPLALIALMLSTVSLAWMLKRIFRILSGAELGIGLFGLPAMTGAVFFLSLSVGRARDAIAEGLISLIFIAGIALKHAGGKRVTEQNAEAEAETARMEQERQQALEREEAVFTDWEDGSEPGEKAPEGSGNEKE